uniref:Uncharacterized protein n=1 Tax=Rhizophora mucronata TaxID=61149 RepID=A0A2P2PAS7_RHIMU
MLFTPTGKITITKLAITFASITFYMALQSRQFPCCSNSFFLK